MPKTGIQILCLHFPDQRHCNTLRRFRLQTHTPRHLHSRDGLDKLLSSVLFSSRHKISSRRRGGEEYKSPHRQFLVLFLQAWPWLLLRSQLRHIGRRLRLNWSTPVCHIHVPKTCSFLSLQMIDLRILPGSVAAHCCYSVSWLLYLSSGAGKSMHALQWPRQHFVVDYLDKGSAS